MTEFLQQFALLEESFSSEVLIGFMKSYPDIPIALTLLYLGLVLYVPKNIMDARSPMKLRWVVAFWNFLLTAFSMSGSLVCVPRVIEIITARGFYASICGDSKENFSDGRVGFWVAAFLLSKIPELMDTVFLVAQKKDVIFLHWFHHVTVMLYCWHGYIVQVPTGLWFATMNFVVHSIMYLYYFLMAVGLRSVAKPFAKLITSLQLLQMAAGITFTILALMWTLQGKCSADLINCRLGLAMYVSYFVLFAMLFKKLYLSKKKGTAASREADKEKQM